MPAIFKHAFDSLHFLNNGNPSYVTWMFFMLPTDVFEYITAQNHCNENYNKFDKFGFQNIAIFSSWIMLSNRNIYFI